MKTVAIIAATAAALFSMSQAAAADGKGVYDKNCAGCHKIMSPKLVGEKDKWEPLIKSGNDALTAAVIKGKGKMPPMGKAGKASLADEDIKAAVEYMLSQIK